MATVAAAAGTLDRVGRWVDSDPILTGLRSHTLKVGLSPFEPSGVDLLAAGIARGVCFDGRPNEIALALPRGRTALPLFLGVYFGVGRTTGRLPLKGSVAVSTRDHELRQILSSIRVAGTGGDPLACGRLVTGRPDPNGRAAAKLGELLGTTRVRGLSQDDRLILLQAPHYRPDLALHVVSLSIVDTSSMAESAWPLSFEWNKTAERAQVWIGELGDRRFEEFCTACDVPLWRFDWPAIQWAAERYGAGTTQLATRELCERSLALPAIRLRACPDPKVDDELALLDQAFAGVYKRTKGEDVPSVVARARRLYYLLGRLVAPLSVYEPIAAGSRALVPNTVLRQVRDAPSGFFEGAKWKSVYDAEWPSIRAALTALYEHVQSEYPKYWDVLMRIDAARKSRELLVIRCATRTEAQALAAALIADGLLDPEELGEGRLVDVRWFGTASPALPIGSAAERLTTLITEPPSPFAGAAYLSAEIGRTEAILYPGQLARFARLARDRWRTSASAKPNNDVVALFSDLHSVIDDGPAFEPEFEQLDPFTLVGRGGVQERAETKEIITMDGFFAQLAALEEGEDRPLWGSGATQTPPPRPARLVRTVEGFCVFLPEDEEVPVLIGSESKTFLRPVAELRAGQRVVLMPGADRSSMLGELFERFDQRLGPAFPILYQRAFQAAHTNAGGDRALAERVGVDEATVATWRRGEHRPQQEDVLYAVLKLSEIEPAWTNRLKIRKYLSTVRGAHRSIAKIFDEAVVETIIELDGPHLKRLEDLGLDLDDFLGSVQVLTVASVSAMNQDAPASAIGHFLTSDHPAVKGGTE